MKRAKGIQWIDGFYNRKWKHGIEWLSAHGFVFNILAAILQGLNNLQSPNCPRFASSALYSTVLPRGTAMDTF